MIEALFIIYLLGTPLLLMNLARRWKWIDVVSPMTLLYAIGLVAANTLRYPEVVANLNTTVGNVAIPLAIPLMLMGCDVRKMSLRQAGKVFASGLAAVLIVSVAGYFLFRQGRHDTDFARVCSVATGMYTGGIPNVGAIAKGVGLDGDQYLFLTSYDLIATGLYLIFIIFAGKTVFRKLLPSKPQTLSPMPKAANTSEININEVSQPLKPFDSAHRRGSIVAIAFAVAIAAVSLLVSMLFSADRSINMTVLILLLTTLAIGASFLKPVRRQTSSFDIGLYFVYVFCFAIANGCDVRQMNIGGSLNILAYVMFVIFGSIVLQVLFARWLKIDGDTVMVSSVALINSPPFVPMAAALLGNKDVVVVGISIGLLGYMLGNYLGIALFHILQLF